MTVMDFRSRNRQFPTSYLVAITADVRYGKLVERANYPIEWTQRAVSEAGRRNGGRGCGGYDRNDYRTYEQHGGGREQGTGTGGRGGGRFTPGAVMLTDVGDIQAGEGIAVTGEVEEEETGQMNSWQTQRSKQ
jgi:hypothetical protein